MSHNTFRHHERQQEALITRCAPNTPIRTYDLPDIDQTALLRRIELARLAREGGRS